MPLSPRHSHLGPRSLGFHPGRQTPDPLWLYGSQEAERSLLEEESISLAGSRAPEAGSKHSVKQTSPQPPVKKGENPVFGTYPEIHHHVGSGDAQHQRGAIGSCVLLCPPTMAATPLQASDGPGSPGMPRCPNERLGGVTTCLPEPCCCPVSPEEDKSLLRLTRRPAEERSRILRRLSGLDSAQGSHVGKVCLPETVIPSGDKIIPYSAGPYTRDLAVEPLELLCH
ncbi:uncharacterized protein LOC123345007 isoform X3 [Mauremys mutica]|uniref:uncharacterized protein LOC123345007 isoform X3 n=1 Tax=Mauremys mutica TaxID=74926 RepID=UPI001D16DD1D|nr:uncharacterized protein LOC123345007 isoform X3 [Mauremys mutica]